ncbi:extensin precursor [Iris pallida]|uniref:Extensin n=1 Tax=Iris pallida TaxID=29817 RepID=A0AAX6FZU7_IRIPA|nr:extensin precursor [Iris pallida]
MEEIAYGGGGHGGRGSVKEVSGYMAVVVVLGWVMVVVGVVYDDGCEHGLLAGVATGSSVAGSREPWVRRWISCGRGKLCGVDKNRDGRVRVLCRERPEWLR